MKLCEVIEETRRKWRIELQECRDALLDTPRASSNPLDRLAVEFDYLLVEAKSAIAKLETENERLRAHLKWHNRDRAYNNFLEKKALGGE